VALLTLTIEGLVENVLPAFALLQLDLEKGASEAANAGAKVGAEHAKTNHRFKNKTGKLESSIGWRSLVVRGTNPSAEFFADTPYANIVAKGSKPHPIDPKPGNPTGLLWWNDPWPDGDLVHAHHVDHPGTAPDPFMDDAAKAAEAETELVLEAHTKVACARADRALR
jgi:hypothetical protein